MTLSFPNPARDFDEKRNAVHFTGYDGLTEVAFFVDTGALRRPAGEGHGRDSTDATFLFAFDALRASIYDVAREAYSHGRRTSYTLTAADFR